MLASFPGAQRRPGYEARPVYDRNTFMEDLDNLLGGSFEEFSALNNLSLNGGWLPWMKLPPPPPPPPPPHHCSRDQDPSL